MKAKVGNIVLDKKGLVIVKPIGKPVTSFPNVLEVVDIAAGESTAFLRDTQGWGELGSSGRVSVAGNTIQKLQAFVLQIWRRLVQDKQAGNLTEQMHGC
jgi:hypothetical protein